MHEFQVNKSDFTQAKLVDTNLSPDGPLEDGEIIVKIDNFALTANNITYAVLGEQLNYWQFFPANENTNNTWGIIPVWGFAHVVSSNNEAIPAGEKLFGYFPPAKYLKMNATHISSQRIIDGSSHRATLPPGYNVYRRVANELGYDSRFDRQRMLLFPLHITSYCLWDYLQDKNWFDAEQLVIVSASSKTSIGLSYALNEDKNAPKVIGMTSEKNIDFVKGLNSYHQVVSYNDINSIDPNLNTVIVDMAGNANQLKAIEKHLTKKLKYCIQVGLTHWDEAKTELPLVDTPSEMFFAPGHIQKRVAEWGPKEFEQRSLKFMSKAAMRCSDWLTFTHIEGLDNMNEVYQKVCSGGMPPEHGIIITP